MALAFYSLWPDLKIGAEIDNQHGTVNHAWVHDGRRAHDGAGTHDDPAAWSPNWSNSTVDMDVSPERLATLMRINWTQSDPWNEVTVYEAAQLIERHWLGAQPDHED